MDGASKVLIVAGVSHLVYASVLGGALAMARMKAPQAPRYLLAAHVEAMIGGAILLGLVAAAGLSDLSTGWEITAAWLVTAGTATVVVGDTTNWLGKTEDGFAQRSHGWKLTALGSQIVVAGFVIFLVGVLQGL